MWLLLPRSYLSEAADPRAPTRVSDESAAQAGGRDGILLVRREAGTRMVATLRTRRVARLFAGGGDSLQSEAFVVYRSSRLWRRLCRRVHVVEVRRIQCNPD